MFIFLKNAKQFGQTLKHIKIDDGCMKGKKIYLFENERECVQRKSRVFEYFVLNLPELFIYNFWYMCYRYMSV